MLPIVPILMMSSYSLRDGKMMVAKVDDKKFVGKDIIHIAVFDKNDKRTIYNMMYRDGKNGSTFIKRFNVSGVTRDKFYDLTQENPGSQWFRIFQPIQMVKLRW